MHNLLIWPLNVSDKIVFSSEKASLSSLTCCDFIDIRFYNYAKEYLLYSGLTGCKLSTFKKELMTLLEGKKHLAKLEDVIIVKSSEVEVILLEIYRKNQAISFNIVILDDIKAWVSQLDLLEVLMQENENEQKNRNNGCCG